MNKYEVMYIVKPLEDEAFEAVVKKFEDLVKNNRGTVEKIDRWGKKRFAYEIQKLYEGLYVVMNFSADAACVAELDRVMKITDELLRHMIVRKTEKRSEEKKDE
ncbi:MAG: 30S ribosomal protein S6 [Phascolarctobacterium sp.]|nr:30S ribosomal protein S6 [Candidatus Phascolarctobacterium caballi]MCQ2381565.1 30S ribosomal protein S6 [Acidaminococcaceae bacterium]